jgi:hypothetical protein
MLNFMTVLERRSRFEELSKSFNMSCVGSCISTIEWFIENGHRSNSLRNGFEEAMQIAKSIKDYENECSEEIRTWESI